MTRAAAKMIARIFEPYGLLYPEKADDKGQGKTNDCQRNSRKDGDRSQYVVGPRKGMLGD